MAGKKRPPEPPSFKEPHIPEPTLPKLPAAVAQQSSSHATNNIDSELAVLMEENEDGTSALEKVTEGTMIKLGSLLEKRIRANQEARTKFSDQPDKFMNSELQLQETLEQMQILATEPSLYSFMVTDTNIIPTVLSVISHENTDMSLTVVDLLNAILDSANLSEADEHSVLLLLDTLVKAQFIQLLVQNLSRLDEANPDEAEAVFKTMGIVDSLIDADTKLIQLLHSQGFFEWLVSRIKVRAFSRNKLYASELLDTILVDSEDSREKFGESGGIDLLLQQLAVYKRHDPANYEEAEMLQNLFNCLCTCLLCSANKERFLAGEGIQLMNLMLRERHLARDTALRVIDYATSVGQLATEPYDEQVTVNNCNKFVEVLGLRTIFPLFMHCPKAKMLSFTSSSASQSEKGAIGPTAAQMEEHIVDIIAALLRFCAPATKSRVLSKFTENDHEKVDRIVELHLKYQKKMRVVEEKINALRSETRRWAGMSQEDIEIELSMKRMEAGELTYQMVDLILAEVCVNGPPNVIDRILRLMKMRGADPKCVLSTCQSYLDNMGEKAKTAEPDSFVGKEVARVSNLISRMSEMLS